MVNTVTDINDRGNIKWTAMMMPEHQMLKDYWDSTERKQKPVLDVQEIQQINMKLQLAIHNDLTVEIKYFDNHDYQRVRGKLSKVDALNKSIELSNDGYYNISLEDILDVVIV